ncbi:MAG: RNA-directed DNA polymerase, partial [Candidatus Brocadiaceae bacterium]|nr:RNA-directed DNA polymerase [Candidatus Brocadiaceae bacterium]
YACRRGKGVHRGVSRLQQFVRKVTKNGTQPAYFLQLDIKNYFMSIDKDILFSMIAPKLSDDEALWLLRILVYHDCTADYHFQGNSGILNKIPPHKSLFKVAKSKGLPIGNLNSQFFANVYLNLLDQFVKHELKCRYYLRYCDDFVFLSRDRDELTMCKDKIETFLVEKLQLELRNSFKLQPVSNGIDFLGYIVRPDYLLVRRRVVNNMQVRLREYKALLVKEGRFYRRYLFDEEMLDRLHAILSSYLGHFKMANSYNLCRSMWEKHTFLDQYFPFAMAFS